MKRFDVQVCGSGIVGQCLALSLARLGLQVALRPQAVAAPLSSAHAPAVEDVRAYALNAASVALLQRLKVWDTLPAHAATRVLDMHVQGDAPGAALDFSAWQQRVDVLAWITDAAVLERQLSAAVRFAPHITLIDAADAAADAAAAAAAAADAADAAAVPVALTALCEGKASATRAALGIGFERHAYGHQAIAARLTSTRAHQGLARQWFRSPDVLALLPFDTPQPGHSFALVWSVPDERAHALLALDAAGFEAQLMLASGGAAGELKLASARAAWPLMRAQASAWCGPGWVLLGDAAHVVHPLAGQGLNLGLADVLALTRVIEQRETWRDLGDEKLLRRYARERAAPTWAMRQVTDGLLTLFADEAPALRELRNRGLTLVNRLSPLKRWLTARALDA